MEKSNHLFQRALNVIPGGVNSPVRAFRSVGGSPFFTKSADGAILTTVDDRKLIDFVSTWGPTIHGHNHPRIKAAIIEALENGTSFGTPNPYEVEMAELIVKMVPSVEKVRMCNSGTEATMACIRLARGFTGRDKIIKFAGCYHGHVDSLLVKAGSGALTFGHPDSAGVPRSIAEESIICRFNDLQSLEASFKEFGQQIAAIIIEPYPANNCLILPENRFLQSLRELCTSYGSLLIFDEVMTGFRIALGGVQEKEGIVPDLTALGKIIGGGLPVGAFGGKTEIIDSLAPEGPVYQAGTLSGNPLAMSAGITALKLLREENPYDHLDQMGQNLKRVILDQAHLKGVPLQFPQAGSMFAMIFSDKPVRNFSDTAKIDLNRFRKIFHYALDNGVYLPPSAFETCFISTAHTEEILAKSSEVISMGIRSL